MYCRAAKVWHCYENQLKRQQDRNELQKDSHLNKRRAKWQEFIITYLSLQEPPLGLSYNANIGLSVYVTFFLGFWVLFPVSTDARGPEFSILAWNKNIWGPTIVFGIGRYNRIPLSFRFPLKIYGKFSLFDQTGVTKFCSKLKTSQKSSLGGPLRH